MPGEKIQGNNAPLQPASQPPPLDLNDRGAVLLYGFLKLRRIACVGTAAVGGIKISFPPAGMALASPGLYFATPGEERVQSPIKQAG